MTAVRVPGNPGAAPRVPRVMRAMLPLSAVVSLLFASPARAQDAPPSAPVEIRLEPYVGALRQIQVSTGLDTLPFLFDTGGGLTLVTPKVAAALRCPSHGVMTGFRHDGARIDVPECGPFVYRVDGFGLAAHTGVFDLDAFLPAEFPRVGGLLSLHTFRAFPVTLDLAANRLVVETDASLAARTRGVTPLRARLSTEAGGEGVVLFLEAAAAEGSLWLLVDSGNLGPVLLAPHALRQLGFAEWAEEAERDTGAVAPREITLDLRGYRPIRVTTQPKRGMIHDGLLNAAWLEEIVLTMDLRDGRAWATPRERKP